MINLLPDEDKKELAEERMRRFLVAAFLAISVVLFLGLVLMTPAYISLTLQRRSLLKELSSVNQAEPLERLGLMEKEIKAFNSKLLLLEKENKKGLAVSEWLSRVLELRPAGVEINSLSFSHNPAEAGKIVLSGKASKREDFQIFVKALGTSALFRKVNSPVSNLLKKTDLGFSLDLELTAP